MSRFVKLTLSGITAISLSLTPSSLSAAPDGEDVAKVLAGIAVLGIIASATRDRNKNRKTVTTPRVTNQFGSIERSGNTRVIDGNIRFPSNSRQGIRRTALPERCVRIVSTAKGERIVYGARCLRREYVHTAKLPNRCKFNVRSGSRTHPVYGSYCLRRDGWQVVSY